MYDTQTTLETAEESEVKNVGKIVRKVQERKRVLDAMEQGQLEYQQLLQIVKFSAAFQARMAHLRDLVDRLFGSSSSRIAIAAFLLVIIFFSLMLYTPWASRDGQQVEFHHAVFTATSAVTVTGLTTVSTAEQWTFFGQLMILLGSQIGGLGTLTLTSILALAVGRKLGLRSKIIAQESLNIGRLGEVGSVLRTVAFTSIAIEALIAFTLIPRFLLLGEPLWQAVWHGVFYAVSSFNNAGFTPHSDGIVPYGHDLWILFPIALGVMVGSLGFPVILVLRNNLTTEEHPLGLYHPHAELHHIKKENIGLIEVMGLAVLPARLKAELAAVAEKLAKGSDLRADELTASHADWAEAFAKNYTITKDNAMEIVQKETGLVFAKVLEHAGVYKRTPEGKEAFLRFIEQI